MASPTPSLPAAFLPGAYFVVTPAIWTGRLSNSGERITLSNAFGETIDSLRYADGADWADLRPGDRGVSTSGWVWDAPHDGDGWDKQTNGSQADYSDLQSFVETMHESDPELPNYLDLVGDVIHTE